MNLAGLVLTLATALPALAGAPVQELPGRPKDSNEPWGAFLGKAAHNAIAIAYRNTHPGRIVFSHTERIANIVEQGRVGVVSNLKECEKDLCPDITDVTEQVVFEIKPDHAEGLEEGRRQVSQYVDVLNKATSSNPRFRKGEDFSGSVFVHFGGGFHKGEKLPAEFRGTLWLPTQCPDKKRPFEAYWEAATSEQACRAQ